MNMLRKYTATLRKALTCMAVSAVVVSAFSLTAQKRVEKETPQPDLSELSMEETLSIPEVPAKQKEYIKSYMKREAQALQKMGYKVETMRQGEVVIATIPADKLFGPNDTTLLASAGKELNNFLPYFRSHGKFKVILAMHSDDTGSENYLYGLTEARIVALYDYFDHYATQTDLLQGYPMAGYEPLKPNNSRKNRAENRRLEIYIVPGPILIADAKTRRV